MPPLDDLNILVTGGLGGIGEGISAELIDKGARVFISHHRGRRGVALRDLGPRAHFVDLDVASEPAWEEAIQNIAADFGALHGLINNAGVLHTGADFTELSLSQWRHQIDVNLGGVFMGCRYASRSMAATGGGSIVNISSGAAYIPVPEAAAYCVSKAAVLALTRVAAKAGGPHNVRVNAILPGAIDTPMLRRNLPDGVPLADSMARMQKLHPLGRIGTPLDVAQAAAFLCDPANSFITGAELAVDGGQLVG